MPATPMGLQPAESGAGEHVAAQPRGLQGFMFALFFLFGGITSLNDILIPKLRELFTLSYAQAMLVQTSFFAAYLVMSIPAAAIVQRLGYMRTAVVGLIAMMSGCLLFGPAASTGAFGAFLLALFILASGITIVQVVANPLVVTLGPPQTAPSRLTFAQAFNSLGTTVFPFFGSLLILDSLGRADPKTLSGTALVAYRLHESRSLVAGYLGLAVALFIIALVVWLRRHQLVEAPSERTKLLQAFGLLKRPRFGFGAASIFLYVGAEVAVGSLIVNYLMQRDVMGLAAKAAGQYVPYYWLGALAGRFVGAYLLRIVSPGLLLAGTAMGSASLLLVSGATHGHIAAYALLAVGLCNSIMFPTIFSLASEGLGRRTAEGSGLICIAIVGGAIVPPLAGRAADLAGLRWALVVPAACYMGILLFGLFARRPAAGLSSH